MNREDVCLKICKCEICYEDSECKLIDAFLKQVPTDVLNRKDGDAECPNCNHHVYYFQKHCVECGQTLKWEVLDE